MECHLGKEAIHDQLLHFVVREARLERAADQAAAATHHRDIHRRLRVAKQALLGGAALMHQLLPPLRIQLAGLAQKLRLQVSSQRHVHIVTAQHEVLPHRQPVKPQPGLTFANAHDREVRGAAANITHQDELPVVHLGLPIGFMLGQPGVKGSQRLFQQNDARQAALLRGRDRQLARYLVKRRRHRQDN